MTGTRAGQAVCRAGVLALALVCAGLGGTARAEETLELHLVLAFDVSASVNDAEFDLQRHGTAAALRSDAVSRAIADAPGGVAVAIVQWSSVTRQALGLDWVILRSAEDAQAYAGEVAAMPRRLPGGGTMIHSGLDFAALMLAAAPGHARRQVIDLAANGQTDNAIELRASRDRLLAQGVVINGLAVEEDDLDLTGYFYRAVIGGPSAFVVTARDHADFGRAMEIKLYREIAGRVVAEGPGTRALARQ